MGSRRALSCQLCPTFFWAFPTSRPPVAAVLQHEDNFPETQNFMMQTLSTQNYRSNERITTPEITKLEQQKVAMYEKHPTETNIDFQWSKHIHLHPKGGKTCCSWGARPSMEAQQPIYTNIWPAYFLINFLPKYFFFFVCGKQCFTKVHTGKKNKVLNPTLLPYSFSYHNNLL